MSCEIGDEVSHGAVYSWVQKSRKALKKEEDRRRKAVFEGKGEEKLALSRAKNLLVLGEGDPLDQEHSPGSLLYGYLSAGLEALGGQNSPDLKRPTQG